MKKHVSFQKMLLFSPLLYASSVLSMYDPALEESRIITPMPQEEGLGLMRNLLSPLYGRSDWVLDDLENNNFNHNNITHHDELNRSFRRFTERKEHNNLTKTIVLADINYRGLIKTEDVQSVIAHEYLTKTHKEKLELFKKELTELSTKHFAKLNVILAELQKASTTHTINAQNIAREHKKEQMELTEASGNDIRKSKEALCNLHALNGTFKLNEKNEQGYCSDYEQDDMSDNRHKTIKNPVKVAEFYNDEHILQKIGISEKNKNTVAAINKQVNELVELNKFIQDLLEIKMDEKPTSEELVKK
jgi:hypothetical protein